MNEYAENTIRYEQIILEKFRFGMESRLSKEFLLQVKVDEIDSLAEYVAHEFAVRIRYELYGKKHTHSDIKYPLDWKESFKERWFPKWLKNKYPVKYQVHHISFHELYPQFKPALPHGNYIVIPYVQSLITNNNL